MAWFIRLTSQYGSLCAISVRYLRRDVLRRRMDSCDWSWWTETESPGLLIYWYLRNGSLESSRSSLMTKSFPRLCGENLGWPVKKAMIWICCSWRYDIEQSIRDRAGLFNLTREFDVTLRGICGCFRIRLRWLRPKVDSIRLRLNKKHLTEEPQQAITSSCRFYRI
jgi:hypothetical protein